MSKTLPPAPDIQFDPSDTERPTTSSRFGRRRVVASLTAFAALGVVASVVFATDADETADTPAPMTAPTSVPESDGPGAATPRVEFIDVPETLRSIEPTEVVALSPTHGLVEISLPSGRVRTTDLSFFTGQSQLAITDFGAIVWPSPETTNNTLTYTIVPPGREPRSAIGGPRVVMVLSTPSRDEFILWPSEVDEQISAVSVNAVVALDDFGSTPFDPEQPTSMDPHGRLLSQSADGVAGTNRSASVLVSTGDLIAAGRNHVVVNECDDGRSCFLATYDIAGRRTLGVETTGLRSDHPFRSALPDGLAPDGSAFLAMSNAGQRQLVIVSVSDGRTQAVHASPTFELDASWASDSSGVFFADEVLRFFRRHDDSVIVVSDSLPSVRAVTARAPRHTVACEFALAVRDRFDLMRNRDDTGPPSARALDGLRTAGPPELAADTAGLVAFVNAFVSPERADSQQIENWPADVRAGVAAIDDFTAVECT